jgi:hypothetical protein
MVLPVHVGSSSYVPVRREAISSVGQSDRTLGKHVNCSGPCRNSVHIQGSTSRAKRCRSGGKDSEATRVQVQEQKGGGKTRRSRDRQDRRAEACTKPGETWSAASDSWSGGLASVPAQWCHRRAAVTRDYGPRLRPPKHADGRGSGHCFHFQHIP